MSCMVSRYRRLTLTFWPSDFGGEPNRVTIWDQSAGAGSVRAQLASPVSRHLFSAVIVGSDLGGYSYGTTYSKYYTPEQEYQVIGAATVTAASCNNKTDVVSCLRAVSAENLQFHVPQRTPSKDRARFVVVDGKYIVSNELNTQDPDRTADIPTFGVTRPRTVLRCFHTMTQETRGEERYHLF